MSSLFEKKARCQTILFLWIFASPIFGSLILKLTRETDGATLWFWFGLLGMIFGYLALVRAKWDQIQKGDLFSWGLSPSAKHLRPLYVASYIMMAGGFVLAGASGAM